MNKVYVKLYVPLIEENYELFIPVNKEISDIVKLLVKSVQELNDCNYDYNSETGLYNKDTGIKYKNDKLLIDTDIKNGTKLILI